jgi:hypothetical protein
MRSGSTAGEPPFEFAGLDRSIFYMSKVGIKEMERRGKSEVKKILRRHGFDQKREEIRNVQDGEIKHHGDFETQLLRPRI